MAEYIDKAKVILRIDNEARMWGDDYGITDVICDIDDFPTADVVEVVRCGECRYHTSKGTCDCPQWLYDDINLYVEPTDFCSYGERKV